MRLMVIVGRSWNDRGSRTSVESVVGIIRAICRAKMTTGLTACGSNLKFETFGGEVRVPSAFVCLTILGSCSQR